MAKKTKKEIAGFVKTQRAAIKERYDACVKGSWLSLGVSRLIEACDIIEQLEAELLDHRAYADSLRSDFNKIEAEKGMAQMGFISEPAAKRIKELEAENKELKKFAEYILHHIVDTSNDGFVFGNTDPQTLKLKAEQALKAKGE